MVISSSCSKDLMSFNGNLYSCLIFFLLKRLTCSVNLYRAFSIIMLYLIWLYIGSATNFALYYSFNSSIATTTGTALVAIDNIPIDSAKKSKSISYIYLWSLLVVAMLRPFLLLCRSSLYTCLGVRLLATKRSCSKQLLNFYTGRPSPILLFLEHCMQMISACSLEP